MPSAQKYFIRLGIVPGNAIEGVSYLDRQALLSEINRARESGDDAHLDFINEDDTHVYIDVRSADIQIIMHQQWQKPQTGRIAVPEMPVPKPNLRVQ